MVAYKSHKLVVVGSSPSSRTKSPTPGGQDIVIEWFDSTMVPINYREVPMDKELKVSRCGREVSRILRAIAEQTRRHPISYSG